eukprot:TRINITY_DN2520_c0_g1_i1.p9 TRINITY_DN2520_c0_g1~~TRINITY_DN2520_c0_g1_i1.p9  ORF type:complete len:336 (+),score=46.55 TRINITY_DN2520_c0_g1_i1:10321-11328(+)
MQKDFRAKEGAADEDMKVKLHKEEMGISLVVSALIRCKKPMVGHNFIYDVGFLYHQFIDDLPENYELFKKRVHDCFPEIYDTKIIARAHNGNYPHYDLEHVLRRSRELNKDVVKFFFPPEFRNLEEVKEGHDAGFDAFCAGKAFAIMANLIKLRVIKGNVFYKGAEVLEELAKGVKKEVEEKKEVNLKEEKKETNIKEVEGKEQNEAKTKLAAMLAGFKHGPAAMANSKKPQQFTHHLYMREICIISILLSNNNSPNIFNYQLAVKHTIQQSQFITGNIMSQTEHFNIPRAADSSSHKPKAGLRSSKCQKPQYKGHLRGVSGNLVKENTLKAVSF